MEGVRRGECQVTMWDHLIVMQCRGMRSGTVPHTLAVGLGAACEIASQEMEVGVIWKREACVNWFLFQYDHEHVSRLSKKLVDGITSQLDYVIRNGDAEQTYIGTILTMLYLAPHQIVLSNRLCQLVICLCGR